MEYSYDEATLTAFRQMQAQMKTKWNLMYQVTITPKGKGQTHATLHKSFCQELNKYRCVKNVFLIAEFENTNHFHGYVYTKDKCKFRRLYNKKHPFNFKISNREQLDWIHYIMGYNQKQYI